MIKKGEHPISKQIIYIIDDDPSVRKALTRFLAVMGMDVLGFSTAEAFLEELPALSAGWLIVDMQMPGMGGLEMLRKAAQVGVHWPSVVVSGSHMGSDDAVTLELGPDRYLRKPFDPADLLRAIQSAAAKSAKTDE